MPTNQEIFDAQLERLDTVTNDIAADYQQLINEGKAKGISAESLAKHEANVARLEGIGASVENPVPETPPEG